MISGGTSTNLIIGLAKMPRLINSDAVISIIF